jgi:DNA-binding MarR family transcriptional regulator
MKRAGREQMVASPGKVALDLTSYVPALVHHIANKLRHSGDAMYKKTFGVGLSEWMVMAVLAGEDGISAQRICEVIGLDKAQVSRVTKGLAQRKLIAVGSDGADSRKSKITLSPKGCELHDRIMLDALEREKRLVKGLNDSEVNTLRSLLLRVHANIPSANSPIRLVKDS